MKRWKRTLATAMTGLALAGCGDASDTEPFTEPSAATVTEPSVEAVTEPSAEATTTTPVDDIASILTAKRANYPAPGALAVIDIDSQRWFGQSGTADVDGTPISPITRFRIASISKPLTAALVLDAVQRGELALDDEVDALVPGLLDPSEPVT
ncbi:MAG TPA: serine hydrolase domain-containing protein, partial [Ilumatobacteraceae bacterium]|nr:serine hydrolase domain-containing protein [Ilumatobacteraceae bacterium]